MPCPLMRRVLNAPLINPEKFVMVDLGPAIEHLKAEIERRLGNKPLARHIFSVAEYSRKVAGKWRDQEVNSEKIYVAGLAHDLFKEYKEKKLRSYISAEKIPLDKHSERIGGGLLHGPAAAHYLRAELGLADRELLAAVYFHTTSRAGASTLEKILFCVDYLDPARPNRHEEPDVDSLRKRIPVALDEVYREILSRKIIHTISKGRGLHPNSVEAWNETCLKRI